MKTTEYGSIDRFRIIAASLIVGIHTYPFASISEDLNFAVIHVLARIAVPFFLMITGFFVLPQIIGDGNARLSSDKKQSEQQKKADITASPDKTHGTKRLLKFIQRTLSVYAVATLLYLPVSIYSGAYSEGNALAVILRNLFFDGTFYHLWYLPASVIGVLIVYGLSRRFSLRMICGVAIFLYLLGLLGDSYYGLTAHIPAARTVYDTAFHVFSYTRNGFFYAPIFLVLGLLLAKERQRLPLLASRIALVSSLILLLLEGFILRFLNYQRHDSMYLALPVVMFVLFDSLLSCQRKAAPVLRDISLWIYILHPLMIIGVRAIARATGLTAPLVENSAVHFLATSFLSIIGAIMLLAIAHIVIALPTKGSLRNNINRVAMVFFASQAVKDTASRNGQGCEKHRNFKKLSWRKRPESRACVKLESAPFPTGRAWTEIDLRSLRRNVAKLREILSASAPPDHPCDLMPAVKADAYGHGAAIISRELNSAGIRAFCVATITEAVELRKQRIKGDILILGYTHSEQIPLIARYHLIQTVIDYEYALLLNSYNQKIDVHIKIDTGMRRLGERSDDKDKVLKIFDCRNLRIKGIYTHLCTADCFDAKGKEFVKQQMDSFNNLLAELRHRGFTNLKTHVHSSYGVLTRLDNPYDYARVGIALYGMLSNSGDLEKCGEKLYPVLSVKARVSIVKRLNADEAAGYGLAFTAPCDMRIAILAIGYADGVPRELSCGAGSVIIHGKKVPIVGRICMDQMTINVTRIPEVKSGDIATIIGREGNEEITACDIARQSNTIANEVLSRLGSRLGSLVCNAR